MSQRWLSPTMFALAAVLAVGLFATGARGSDAVTLAGLAVLCVVLGGHGLRARRRARR